MTKEQAEEIVSKMKQGLAFSDEDMISSELWSLSYDPEKNEFSYTTMWMVIGSILSNNTYTETELLTVLENSFDYQELMSNSYWQDRAARDKEGPSNKEPKSS